MGTKIFENQSHPVVWCLEWNGEDSGGGRMGRGNILTRSIVEFSLLLATINIPEQLYRNITILFPIY